MKLRSIVVSALCMLLTASVFSGVAAAKPLSKKAFVAAADEICTDTNDLIESATNEHFADVPAGTDPTDEQLEAYIDDIEPIVGDEVDALRDLEPPKKDKKKIAKLLKAVEKGYGVIFDDPVGTYYSPDSPLEKAAQLAQGYGFHVCGS